MLVEVDAQSAAESRCPSFRSAKPWRRRHLIEDGHLLIAMWRGAHALSVL